MHAAACGGLAPARCRNRSIKRHAYAFELRPLWPRNERRASSRAGRAHDGTKPMQHACRPAKGTPAAEAEAAPAGSLWTDVSGHHRRAPPFPRLILSSAFLPVRASLAHTDTSHGSAAGCSSPAALLPLAQAIDVRAMNGHSGKQTWIRREKGTGGPPACTPARPARAAHGMESAREDDDEASFSIRSSSLLPYTRYTFAMTMISLRSASFASCQGCRRL